MADDFREIQLQLAAHLRDPDNNPPPEALPDERLAVYRRLFLNNITNLISRAFPVLHEIYGDERWQDLIKQFYASHKSHTPYFSKIAREFLDYLKTEYPRSKDDPPFLAELAHYEWVEIALSHIDRSVPRASVDQNGDLLEQCPVLSPLAWILSYRWPVHEISPKYQPSAADESPTHIVLCRNADGTVRFIKINAVTKALLQNIRKHPGVTGRQHIESAARQLNLPLSEQILQSGLDLLGKMRDKEVILGTAKTAKA